MPGPRLPFSWPFARTALISCLPMRRRRTVVPTLLVSGALLAFGRSGYAQDELPPAPEPDADASSETTSEGSSDTATSSSATTATLRDPEGIKGISPFWEALSEGDRAFVAQDIERAIAAYRQAIVEQPKNPLGHYRLGEAFLKKEDFTAAEEAWQAGMRFAGTDAMTRGKLLFCLADLRERTKNYGHANNAWSSYAQAVTDKAAKGHPATAVERKKRIAERQRLEREYAAVKARIAQRMKEADAESKRR